MMKNPNTKVFVLFEQFRENGTNVAFEKHIKIALRLKDVSISNGRF